MKPQENTTSNPKRIHRSRSAWIVRMVSFVLAISLNFGGVLSLASAEKSAEKVSGVKSPAATSTTSAAISEEDEILAAILKEALDLSGSEQEEEAALKRLNARPRANVVKAVKALIKSPKSNATIDTVLNLVVALELKEVAPELQGLAYKNDFWRLIFALNKVYESDFEKGEKFAGRANLSAFYLKRLNEVAPAATKMALIDGLALMKVAIPKPLFRKLLDDGSYQVREAIAEHLILNRGAYAKEDQIERFKWVFSVKPYQVRLDAMEAFARFPAAERQSLSGALDSELCDKEANVEVQKACRVIAPKTQKGKKR